MSDDAQPRGSRRRRAQGGRPHRVVVRLTDDELVRIRGRAAVLGITVQGLLVESALTPPDAVTGMTATERAHLLRELFRVQHKLAGAANNINQLARAANSGDPPSAPQTAAALAWLRRCWEDVAAVLEQVPR